MKVIGMCGGSGSGKGVTCRFFAELGIKIIDTDKVYHALISSDTDCLREIVDTFGESILDNGRLNRSALADIVFSSKEHLNLLNTIAHKHILSAVRDQIYTYRKVNAIGVIVDAPALFESGFDKECDAVIAVCADIDIRIERIMARDKITTEKAFQRIKSQKSDEWLRSVCDYFIENNGTEVDLKNQVFKIAKEIFDI